MSVEDEVKGSEGGGNGGGSVGEQQQLQVSADIVAATPNVPVAAVSTATVADVGQTDQSKSSARCQDDNEDNGDGFKDEREETAQEKIDLSPVRVLGEPLVSHGPYTFYGALGYRDVTKRKRRRWKKRQTASAKSGDDDDDYGDDNYDDKDAVAEPCKPPSPCRCAGGESCSCNGHSSLFVPEWSEVRMNHFYAVRPWYSKKNSSAGDRQQLRQERRRQRRRKNSPPSKAAATERRQHHHQQSVFIGELELLWRDDSVAMAARRGGNRNAASTSAPLSVAAARVSNGGSDGIDAALSSSNSLQGGGSAAAASSDDEENSGCGNDNDLPASLPRRRLLPRRTRQPSAKKIEATESYAAAAAAAAPSHHPSQQQSSYGRSHSVPSGSGSADIDLPQPSTASHYAHENLLCSVRLYVMPDQTAAGRLSGVHGEDEVLEINTWGASGGVDGNMFVNGGIGSTYNGGGGDDYGYGSGSHALRALPSGCSGLVLRAEDFIEWVRGGMMNDDDDDEFKDSESEGEFLASECDNSINNQIPSKEKFPKQECIQKMKLMPLQTDIKEEFCNELQGQKVDNLNNVHTNIVAKLESTVIGDISKECQKNKESLTAEVVELNKVKKEQTEVTKTEASSEVKKRSDEIKYISKSVVDEAVEAEFVPLAAAKIIKKHSGDTCSSHQHHRKCKSLSNGGGACNSTVSTKHTILATEAKNTTDNKYDSSKQRSNENSSYKQRLVVMSYSRYCRYRAQLQRKCEINFGDAAVGDKEKTAVATNRVIDSMNMTRVLFCRDTYDYPAELLLQPFNPQQAHQQNTAVLVNHMAPKLKGWPAYPASWMSFRWNRVRRRLRHLERGNSSNDEQRRRRRRKLKKKSHRRQNGAVGTTVALGYSSSTEDRDSDDSDNSDASSATNDGATNTTTTASTSDSDGAPPPPSVVTKPTNKSNLASNTKENYIVHQHNKRTTICVSTARSTITINGTTVSTVVGNKRLATTSQQQSTKRRRFAYTPVASQLQQQQQQKVVNQQLQGRPRHPQQLYQSHNRSRQSDQFDQFSQSQRQHMFLVHQQQQRLQSLNKRVSTSVSSLPSPSTRIIHHHLPPSVSIMPVTLPNTTNNNFAALQQQQRLNNRTQSRPKQYASVSVTQRLSTNSGLQRTPAPRVIFEYDDDDREINQEIRLKNNGQYPTTVATAMAAYQRRAEHQNNEDNQVQQREDEERQRRWLVDALRLGGLEVTAVPSKIGTGSGNNRDVVPVTTIQQKKQQWQQGDNEPRNGNIQQHQDNDSNQDSDTDSVVMTVTPDVICLLNKSQQQSLPGSSSTVTVSAHHQQQQRRSVTNSSSSQQQNPVATTAIADKIYRAIDSLNQQPSNLSEPYSSSSNKLSATDGSNSYKHNSNNNNRLQDIRRPKNSGLVGTRQQQMPTLLDLSVKSSKHLNTAATTSTRTQKSLPTSINNLSQQRKGVLPFLSDTMAGSSTPPANLEITIVPVTAPASSNVTKLQPQQHLKFSSPTSAHNNLAGGSELLGCSSSMTVRQQLQRRNTNASTAGSAQVIDVLCIAGNQQQHQQRNGGGTSVNTTASSSKHVPVKKSKTQQNKKD